MARVTLDAQKLAKHVTVTVDLTRWREWTLRLKVATWLVRLAAWIAWLGYEEEGEPKKHEIIFI
jgi:hypothetical protein